MRLFVEISRNKKSAQGGMNVSHLVLIAKLCECHSNFLSVGQDKSVLYPKVSIFVIVALSKPLCFVIVFLVADMSSIPFSFYCSTSK